MTSTPSAQPTYYVSQFDLDRDGQKDHIVFSFVKTDEKHALVAGKAVLANGQVRDLGRQSYDLQGVTNHGKKLEAFHYDHGGFDAHQLYLLPHGVEMQHEQLCQTIDDSDAKYNYPNQQCSDPIRQFAVSAETIGALVARMRGGLPQTVISQDANGTGQKTGYVPDLSGDAILQRLMSVW